MALREDKAVRLIRRVLDLEPIEFLGICKVLGVKTFKQENDLGPTVEGGTAKVTLIPRPFEDIWADVCDAIDGLNRVQKRNLDKLLKAATKKEN